MEFVKMTEMLGDATYWLKAEGIPDGFMVEDAIKWVVSLYSNEFGRIYVEEARRIKIANYQHCEITSEDSDMIAQLQGREVEKIEANGGWGQMNYYITLKRTKQC